MGGGVSMDRAAVLCAYLASEDTLAWAPLLPFFPLAMALAACLVLLSPRRVDCEQGVEQGQWE